MDKNKLIISSEGRKETLKWHRTVDPFSLISFFLSLSLNLICFIPSIPPILKPNLYLLLRSYHIISRYIYNHHFNITSPNFTFIYYYTFLPHYYYWKCVRVSYPQICIIHFQFTLQTSINLILFLFSLLYLLLYIILCSSSLTCFE
jgi:hypothetical protein